MRRARNSAITLLSIVFAFGATAGAQSPQAGPVQVTSATWMLQNPPNVQVSGVSVNLVGNPGPSTLYFWIVSNFLMGSSAPAGPFLLTSAPNVLTAQNYAVLSWQRADGAISYDVLLTTTPLAPQGQCNCAAVTGTAALSANVTTNTTTAYSVVSVDANAYSIIAANLQYAAGISSLNYSLPKGTLLAGLDSAGGFRSLALTPVPDVVANLALHTSGGVGTIVTVIDGQTTSDCITGGGSISHQCIYQGAGVWQPPTAAGGGNIVTGAQYQLMYYGQAGTTGFPDPNTSSSPTQFSSTHPNGIHATNGFFSDAISTVGVLTLTNPGVASFTIGATGVTSNYGWDPPHVDAAGPLRMSGSLGGDGRDQLTLGLQQGDLSSPPTIGDVAPNTGKFTTLTATGNVQVGNASGGLLNAWELQSNQPNPAATGICFVCMGRGDQEAFRNWANNGNNAFQLCGNNGGVSGVSNDAPCWLAPSINSGTQQPIIIGTAYQTIQQNGTALTPRSIVNAIPGTNVGVNCVDNPAQSRTDCTFSAFTSLPAYTILGNNSGLTAPASATISFFTPVAGDPGSYSTDQSWLDTNFNIAKVALSSSTYARLAHFGLLTGFNAWASNYLNALVGFADFGGAVNAPPVVVVADSTVGGSSTPVVPASNNTTSWFQEIASTGLAPKLIEKIQGRIGQPNGTNGFGGDGYIPTFTALVSGGQAPPVNASVNLTGAPNIVQTGHVANAGCPDDTLSQDNTAGDIVCYTDNLTTRMTFFALGEGATAGSVACNVDGGSYGASIATTSSSYGSTLAGGYGSTCDFSGLTEGSHTLCAKVASVSGGIGVGFCAVRAQDTTQTATAEPGKLASGGAELNQWNTNVSVGALQALYPDVSMVLIESGPNEHNNNDRTPTQLASDYHAALTKVRSAWPNASVFYVLPQDDYRNCGGSCNYSFDTFMQFVKQQANLDSVGVFDLYDSTSNATQLANWANCPYAGGSVGNCSGVHFNDGGNAWAASIAFHQVTDFNTPPPTGYGWNIRAMTSNYSLTPNDFSGPYSKGSWLYDQVTASPTYTLPATAPGSAASPACVRMSNLTSSTGVVTVAPNGASVDGDTTNFTLAHGQWAEVCGVGGPVYKMVGLTSRNGPSPNLIGTDSGTSGTNYIITAANLSSNSSACVTSLGTGLTVSFLPLHNNSSTAPTLNVCGLGNKTAVRVGEYGQLPLVLNDMLTNQVATFKYNATATTWELQNPANPTGALDSGDLTYTPANGAATGCTGAVNIVAPATDTHFACWVEVSQTVASVGCGTQATIGFGLGWVDHFTGTAVNSGETTNNFFTQIAPSGTFGTAVTATEQSIATTLTTSQIWTGFPKHIFDKASGQVAYCLNLQTAPLTCTTQPTFTYRVRCDME